ncbi:TonB-dependent receptor [Ancylomarina longa]|uniref:TonB-dependent receptor n=1 Tax=Ancylomarina longa TaxID=2487017 RepID=A0A434ATV8_9BACT|nr:TonB-dependent receptor [Ancylomarina longa]
MSFALYSNFKWLLNPVWIINSGIRYSQSWINAKLNTSFYPFPFDNLNLSNGALTGAIGVTHQLSNKLNSTTGFRAPNIDDVGKVFDSEPGKVIVPNKDLKPEYVYNLEGDISKTFFNQLFLDVNIFYSYLDQAMVREEFTFNSKNTILYDGELSEVQALVNEDNTKIYGTSFQAILKISDKLNASSFINSTQGKYKNGSPVRHVPPIFGNFILKFKSQKFTSRLTMQFNGHINYKNLADSERGKAYLYAKNSNDLPYSPSWTILNTSVSYQFKHHVHLQFTIENLLNKRYRPYSSGICAAGRNIIASLTYKIK